MSEPGLATVEIVGFGGQTALTTRFGNRNCTKYHILKTNYATISATDSGAAIMKNKISLSGGGRMWHGMSRGDHFEGATSNCRAEWAWQHNLPIHYSFEYQVLTVGGYCVW